jgi:hypothetical protein
MAREPVASKCLLSRLWPALSHRTVRLWPRTWRQSAHKRPPKLGPGHACFNKEKLIAFGVLYGTTP